MYYSFVDASGKHLHNDPENFVLNSVTIHKSHQKELEERIDHIKEKHFPDINPRFVEFHATDMVHYRGIFKKMKAHKIYKMFDDMFDMVSDESTKLFIVSSVIKKPKIYFGTDIEELAYGFMLEGIDREVKSRDKSLKAILEIDSEGDRDDYVMNKIYRITKNGTKYSNLQNISHEKIIQNSKSSNLLQLCDVIGYAIRKRHRDGNAENKYNQKWELYYSQLRTKFSKVKGRHYNYGLMVFPKINWLTTSHVEKNNIRNLKVLKKPQIYETYYGDNLQCIVGCDDGSVRMLDINKSRQSRIAELGFDLKHLLDKSISISISYTGKTRSINIEGIYEKRWDHADWHESRANMV